MLALEASDFCNGWYKYKVDMKILNKIKLPPIYKSTLLTQTQRSKRTKHCRQHAAAPLLQVHLTLPQDPPVRTRCHLPVSQRNARIIT